MPHGTIKWFNREKGYGFILQQGGGSDLFVHNSQVDPDTADRLDIGRQVEFEVAAGERGPQASRVRVL